MLAFSKSLQTKNPKAPAETSGLFYCLYAKRDFSITHILCYTAYVENEARVTKNITLAIDEDLLDKVRVLAALKRTSVNELVRGFLTKLVEQERAHDEARTGLLNLMETSPARLGKWRPDSEAAS